QLQHVEAGDVLFGEGAVQQIEAQDAGVVGEQFELRIASLDLNRALGPGQVGVFHAAITLHLVDAGQVLLGAAVGFDVHERVETGHAVADPASSRAFRQAAEQRDVEDVGAHTGNYRNCPHRHFIDFAPGLVGGVTVVAARHFESRDLVALLIMHADMALRQLQHLGFAGVDLQLVIQQFAFDSLLMLAALRQLVGAAAEEEGAAQGGADEAKVAARVHDVSVGRDQRLIRACRKDRISASGTACASVSARLLYSRLPSARPRSLTTTRCGIPISSISANLMPGLVFLSRSSSSTSKPAAVSSAYSLSVASRTCSVS